MKHFDLSLYLVLDPLLCATIGMVETARLAVAGGATMVQLRDKQAGTAAMIEMGRALQDVLRPGGATLIINDDVEAAVALGAGLHIGQEDMMASVARSLIGPEPILGLSVETEALAAAIDPSLVDYAGVGPVFATPTKPDHKPHIGFDGLRRLVSASPVPTVAIGGLKVQHVDQVFQAGADGIAVVSAICGVPNPEKSSIRTVAGNSKGTPMIRNVLSVAGSDPSGGAGIQADLKTFAARGVFGMAALTSLTVQNTQGVSGIHLVPLKFVADQIAAVFADIRVDAVKIGMIADAAIAGAVADALEPHKAVPVVLDPVMIAKGGTALLDSDAIAALISRLLPLATLLTPNLPEAAALLGEPEARTRDEMAGQAIRLRALGPANVLVKGGHLGGATSPDVLATAEGLTWYEAARTETANTHGTGCTLSSALAAELAKGASMQAAMTSAKAYLAAAVATAHTLNVGSGHGPVQHFHELWQPASAKED